MIKPLWFNFLIIGLLAATVWTCFTWGRLTLIVRLVGGFSSLAVLALSLYILQGGAFLASEAWYNSSPFRELVLFGFMITGMTARYFTKLIEQRRQEFQQIISKEERKKIKLNFDLWEFSYPLFISVITFGTLMAQLKDEMISLTNIILSFQTGFFWQTILSRTEGRQGSTQ